MANRHFGFESLEVIRHVSLDFTTHTFARPLLHAVEPLIDVHGDDGGGGGGVGGAVFVCCSSSGDGSGTSSDTSSDTSSLEEVGSSTKESGIWLAGVAACDDRSTRASWQEESKGNEMARYG